MTDMINEAFKKIEILNGKTFNNEREKNMEKLYQEARKEVDEYRVKFDQETKRSTRYKTFLQENIEQNQN